MTRLHLIAATVALGVFVCALRAENAYYHYAVADLPLTEGALPAPATQPAERSSGVTQYMRPYAVIDGGGEAYFSGVDDFRNGDGRRGELFICAPAGDLLSGRLYLPKSDSAGMVTVKFKVQGPKANPQWKQGFLEAKRAYYQWMQAGDMPGGAWCRYQIRLIDKELGTPVGPNGGPQDTFPVPFANRGDEIDRTFGLFSADRAVSENLQLDRALRPSTAPAEPKVDADSIAGITVREFDWKPLVKDLKPQLDPLASLIPADQHAIFFPTFAAMVMLADEANRQGTPLLALAEPQSQDAGVKERYQKQLCLSMTELGRLLGPRLIGSVAITGSDPYLRMGSDVAVLFEAKDAKALEQLLLTRMVLSQLGANAVSAVGEVDGVRYTGANSADRALCTYIATVGANVVVTNSKTQLARIVAVSKGTQPALASLPEYTFFRDRYKRGDADETALIVLSDATIRRWCSAKWRIADSRRARAAAVMSQLQAEHADALAHGAQKAEDLTSPWGVPELGKLAATPAGVTSSTYGNLEFMTPIVELPMDKVTESERDAYVRWRDGYQRNWRWGFDPIAARITTNDKKLAADITVMPLIFSTEYSDFVSIARGVKIGPGAGDPHGALIHFAMAINRDSRPMREWGNVLGLKVDPLSWLGQTVAAYADDDPFWAELARQPHPEKFLQEQVHRLPVAVYAEVRNGLKFAIFLTAVRVLVDQAAPGMVTWETLTYRDQQYVCISPTAKAAKDMHELEQVRLYYAPTSDAILVSLREDMIQRFIDRQIDRGVLSSTQPSTLPKAAKAPTTLPWLGESACLQVDRRFADAMIETWRPQYQEAMQARAWSNIPILNEWKRLYPKEDPVKLHERLWQMRLICPGGGSYVWNEQWQTMESTVYGHPGQPKPGPTTMPWAGFKNGNFGMTFENDGVRARTVIEKE